MKFLLLSFIFLVGCTTPYFDIIEEPAPTGLNREAIECINVDKSNNKGKTTLIYNLGEKTDMYTVRTYLINHGYTVYVVDDDASFTYKLIIKHEIFNSTKSND